MKASYYERNGSAREVMQVGDIPTPVPAAGEVRVKLATSGVNPSDVKARQGSRKIAWPQLIPHSDGAGVIDQVGDGVPASRVGERVWVWNGQWKRPFGTAAEYIVLPAAQAVPLPASIGFDVGACLGIPALTAWHAVVLAEIGKGSTVLVTGGAGAVGQYVIQFAKATGATVIATISSADKAAMAKEAGADHTVNYKSEDVPARVMAITGNKPIDAIIDMDIASNAKDVAGIIKPKGNVIIYGTSNPQATIPAGFSVPNSTRYQFFIIYEITEAERNSAIAGITRALEAGALKHRIAPQTFRLDDIVAAHEAVEKVSVGNIVITI